MIEEPGQRGRVCLVENGLKTSASRGQPDIKTDQKIPGVRPRLAVAKEPGLGHGVERTDLSEIRDAAKIEFRRPGLKLVDGPRKAMEHRGEALGDHEWRQRDGMRCRPRPLGSPVKKPPALRLILDGVRKRALLSRRQGEEPLAPERRQRQPCHATWRTPAPR